MSEASSCHSPPSPADSAPNDVLAKILLHLPPHPKFLSCTSLVCKRWRGVVHDPSFLRHFRAFHRTPTMIGLFRNFLPRYVAVEGSPGHIDAVARRFNDAWLFLECRDGHALLHNHHWTDLLVWDPMTDERHCITLPHQVKTEVSVRNAAVFSDSASKTDECYLSLFHVAIVFTSQGHVFACVYTSRTGLWGEVISLEQSLPCEISTLPGVLISDTLYWLADYKSGILKLELGRQILSLVEHPPGRSSWNFDIHVMKSEDSGLGVAIVEEFILQLWAQVTDHDDTVKWVLCRTIDLFTVLRLPFYETPGADGTMETHRTPVGISAISEDGKVVVVTNWGGILLLWLDTLRFKHVGWQAMGERTFYPYASFYVPEGSLKRFMSSPVQPGASARQLSPSLSGKVPRSSPSTSTTTLATLSPPSSSQTQRTPAATSLTRHSLPQRSALPRDTDTSASSSTFSSSDIVSSMTQNPLGTLGRVLGTTGKPFRGALAKWRGWCSSQRTLQE